MHSGLKTLLNATYQWWTEWGMSINKNKHSTVHSPNHHHHHHHWAAIVSRRWAKASSCRLHVSLSRAVLCQIVSLQYFSRSSLHRLSGLTCRLFLSYGLQVVTREVHRSSLRRLICPAQDHLISLTLLFISMTFILSLTQMLVFLSLYVMLSILLSILVNSVASLFCACLVSVMPVHHMP